MEDMGKKDTYTEKEVIGFTLGILEGISWPGFLMELPPAQVMGIKQNIIDPIAAAKGNLRVLMDKFRETEEATGQQKVLAGEAEEGAKDMDPEDEEIVGEPMVREAEE